MATESTFSTLTVLFIVLKLLGIIHWSWVWVLSPFWIPLLIWMALTSVVLIIAYLD